MKLADLFDKKIEKEVPFKSHSANDLIASIKKVLEGANFNTMEFNLKSSEEELGRGLLKFSHKSKNYKITHDGKIYEGTKLVYEFKPNMDIHSHYSHALHHIAKIFRNKK